MSDRYVTLRQYAMHRGITLQGVKRRIEAGKIPQEILKHDGRRYWIDAHEADDILDGFQAS